MANLNETDLLVGEGKKFKDLEKSLEAIYGFKIIKTRYPSSVSLTSKKAVLETNIGQFFLKEKPLYCSDELSLQRSFLFQDFCSNSIDCVPKIIKTKTKDFYFPVGDRKYFLSEYINGRHYNGSEKDIMKMLNVILEINIIGQKFLEQERARSGVNKKFESYQIATLIPELDKYVKNEKERQVVADIRKTFHKLSEEYKSIGNDNFVMAHSDCILFNFIFTDSKAYLIDFDNAKVLPRIHDFAEFFVSATILNYLAAIANLKKPVFLSFDKKISKTILNFYREKLKFSGKEFLLFPVVCDIVWLWTLVLSVIKEDYLIEDLQGAIDVINKKVNRKVIQNTLSS